LSCASVTVVPSTLIEAKPAAAPMVKFSAVAAAVSGRLMSVVASSGVVSG